MTYLDSEIEQRVNQLREDALELRARIRQSDSLAEIRQLRKLNNLLGATIEALQNYRLEQ